MGKNIYEMLNDVKINEDEYERMELTEFDKAQKQKRILKKIKKNNKSGKNIRKAALAAAAACAVVIGAAGAANPAMAKDLFSSTIGKLIENRQGTKDEKETKIYEKIAEGSLTAQEETAKHQDKNYNTSANVTYQINKEDNGVKVCDVVKTKAGLVLTVETPDFTKKPYNDPYNDPDLAVVDTDGNSLQWLYGGIYKQNDDGTAIYKIMVLYENQTDLTFEVTNKNVNDKKIASIDFEIQ